MQFQISGDAMSSFAMRRMNGKPTLLSAMSSACALQAASKIHSAESIAAFVLCEYRLLVAENRSDERHLVRLNAGAVDHLEHLRSKAKREAVAIVAIDPPLAQVVALCASAI
jgi:hypothetical protein